MHLPLPKLAPPPVPAPLAAVTGATGFIGRHVVDALVRAGWRVRLLLRSAPSGADWRRGRPEVVAGALDDEAALERLVDGADAVVHLAGRIKAPRRADFFKVNRDGVELLARTVKRRAPGAHFVLVSSLAAREPQLSDYAASKQAGERAALDLLGARVTVLRPPAVYGPGDRETLLFFQLAGWRHVPLLGAPGARAAMVHVSDLAQLVAALAAAAPLGAVVAAADARPEGYGWRELLAAAALAVGNPAPRFFQTPPSLLTALASVGSMASLFGSASMLNRQKLRELRHPDWSVPTTERLVLPGWSPRFDLGAGFTDAVTWYRAHGWLPPRHGDL